MRNWRQIRAVGLDQHAVDGYLFCRVANLLRFGKGYVAGKRDHESHVQRQFRVGPGSSEAMQNATQSTGSPMLLDQAQAVLPGILASLGGSAMNYDRESCRSGEFHLSKKNSLLDFAWR